MRAIRLFVGARHAGDWLFLPNMSKFAVMASVSKTLKFLPALLLGGFLVSLAWPRLYASWLYLPVDTAIDKYYTSRENPSAQLDALQQRAERAISAHEHHRYHDGLSLLNYLQGIDQDFPLYQRKQALEASIQSAETALSLAPAQPRTWLRIAQARSRLFYPAADVIEPFEMAVLTGRVEPSMFMTRLALGLAYLRSMNDAQKNMVRDQLLLAWKMQPHAVKRALKDKELKMEPVETLLAGTHSVTLQELREVLDGPVR